MQINNLVLTPRPLLRFWGGQKHMERQPDDPQLTQLRQGCALEGDLVEPGAAFLQELEAGLQAEVRLLDTRVGELLMEVVDYRIEESSPGHYRYTINLVKSKEHGHIT